MLIQNNSTSYLTKYFSIFLNETFNSNINVTTLYNNSEYTFVQTGDDIVVTGYVCYPYPVTTSTANYYKYGYIIGALGNVVNANAYFNYDTESSTINGLNLPTVDFDKSLKFNQCVSVDLVKNNKCIIVQIDVETGELLTDIQGNYVVLNNDFNIDYSEDTQIATFFTDIKSCRKQSELCSYIFQWLVSQYSPVFNEGDNVVTGNGDNIVLSVNNKIYRDCNIANYFANYNTDFNLQKLPFDIDDLVGSYLLGRTISDSSSEEEIEYAQNLIRYNHYVKLKFNEQDLNKYIGPPGTWRRLHLIILWYQLNLNYRFSLQQEHTSINTFNLVIPTGFVDIITERYLLNEYEGDAINGYYRETNSVLRTN